MSESKTWVVLGTGVEVDLGAEEVGNSGTLWQRSVIVRRRTGSGEDRYLATLVAKAAPDNEVHLWQGGDAAPLLGVLPLDVVEWNDDAALAAWVATCYQRDEQVYKAHYRGMVASARAAYTAQNEESAPF